MSKAKSTHSGRWVETRTGLFWSLNTVPLGPVSRKTEQASRKHKTWRHWLLFPNDSNFTSVWHLKTKAEKKKKMGDGREIKREGKTQKEKNEERFTRKQVKTVHATWLKRELKMIQESLDSFPEARVKKMVLKHAEINRANEYPTASTDKEKCIARTPCFLFRVFQGHLKREQANSPRKKNFTSLI